MEEKRIKNVWVLVVLLLALITYVGSYFALTDRGTLYLVGYEMSARVYFKTNGYRFGGKRTEWLYSPLRVLDRRIRYHYWHPRAEPGGNYVVETYNGPRQFRYPEN